MSTRMHVYGYALTIFLSSAFLLVLEMVAGRLIAPYVGVSLYTWTSIIGVILAGLSLGNWIGGVWADRGGSDRSAGLVLVGSALASLAVLLILTLVAPLLQESELSLLSISFLMVLSLFFLPAVLLGIVTPLLTTLALKLDQRTGHIVGLMHALAALGSILGTFVTGYWLVQYIGTRSIIIATSIGLFLLALPLLRRTRPAAPLAALVVAALLSGAIWVQDGFANPCYRESSYFCIRVVDSTPEVPFGEARSMILDHLLHGTNHKQEPGLLLAPYVQLMDELVLEHWNGHPPQGMSFFYAGGGAYTQPRAVQSLYTDAEITVAELDPNVTEVAREQLYLDDSGMNVHHADARVVLQQMQDERFDVVVTDVFHDIAVPYHLVTKEYAQLVKGHLKKDGLYTLNLVDIFPDPKLVKSMVKTLDSVFEHVHVWIDNLPEESTRMTYVISASDAREPPEVIESRRGFERAWVRMTKPVVSTGTPLSELPLLSDDYVPVDRLVSTLFFSEEGK
ncbi:MAG: fused MFS/spermidine synthase [Candidatus Sedimenticola sp. 6PFRAG7]